MDLRVLATVSAILVGLAAPHSAYADKGRSSRPSADRLQKVDRADRQVFRRHIRSLYGLHWYDAIDQVAINPITGDMELIAVLKPRQVNWRYRG